MRLIGIMPVRNEAWCLRASLSSLLRWCDYVEVLLHCCTDGSLDIVRDLRRYGRLNVSIEEDPVWREAKYRERLLRMALAMDATHIATIDADEVLAEVDIPRVREQIERLKPGQVLRAPWRMLWGSLETYRGQDRSVWSDATAPIAFCADGAAYPQVDYDIHCRAPAGETVLWETDAGLMHLQHVERRRVVAKQALYRAVERERFGTSEKQLEMRYGPTTDEAGMKLLPVPADWWGPEKAMIRLGEVPWQEVELARRSAVSGPVSVEA